MSQEKFVRPIFLSCSSSSSAEEISCFHQHRSRPSQKQEPRTTGHRQMHFSLGDVKRNWQLEFNACLTLPMRRH